MCQKLVSALLSFRSSNNDTSITSDIVNQSTTNDLRYQKYYDDLHIALQSENCGLDCNCLNEIKSLLVRL